MFWSVASADNALQILDDFGNISGLRLNKEKTQGMWLGTWADRKEKPLGLICEGPHSISRYTPVVR